MARRTKSGAGLDTKRNLQRREQRLAWLISTHCLFCSSDSGVVELSHKSVRAHLFERRARGTTHHALTGDLRAVHKDRGLKCGERMHREGRTFTNLRTRAANSKYSAADRNQAYFCRYDKHWAHRSLCGRRGRRRITSRGMAWA